MVARIRRNRKSPPASIPEIEELMKSISTHQSLMEQHAANVKTELDLLLVKMKAAGMVSHRVEDITADITRSAGKASNYIDPAGFRKLVKDDKEFYSAISVSVTAAKKVLPEKSLARITTTTPGTAGPEYVKVKRG